MTVRKIDAKISFQLWNSSKWMCQFPGCKEQLYINTLTFDVLNLSEQWHIIAYSKKWPRWKAISDTFGRSIDKNWDNTFDNLILLCRKCHKTIDTFPEKYDIEKLKQIKKDDIDRKKMLLETLPNHRRFVIKFTSAISWAWDISISDDEIYRAMFAEKCDNICNFESQPLSIEAKNPIQPEIKYWENVEYSIETNKNGITAKMERVVWECGGISVFWLWSIPSLIKLWSILPKQKEIDIYNRSRDSTWKIPSSNNPIIIEKKNLDSQEENVIVILHFSGKITENMIPSDCFPTNTKIYSLGTEVPQLWWSPPDTFGSIWRQLLAEIWKNSTIHLFASVSNSIAINIWLQHEPGLHPQIKIYEFNKDTGKFYYTYNI